MTVQKPNFFMLGAPKCGTTSLAAWLSEHPQIYFSPTKEPKFFSTDIQHQKYVKTQAQYENLFEDSKSEHIAIGEGSTEYLYSQKALDNILAYNPKSKFIVCLRNPVTLAPSLHEQHIFEGDETILDFWSAWSAQFPSRDKATIPAGPYDPIFYQYGARCKLGEQLERVFARVPRERVMVIMAEDLRHKTIQIYRDVLDFLDVEQDGRVDFPNLNSAKELRHPSVKRWLNYANYVKNKLGITTKTGIVKIVTQWNKKDRPRPPLPDVHRLALEDYFRDDIAKLQSLLDRDLGHWIKGYDC